MACSLVFPILLLSTIAHAILPSSSPNPIDTAFERFSNPPQSQINNPLLSDPPFLARLSAEARRQYNDIINNDSLTPNQIEQQLAKWAQSNGVVNELKKFQQEQKTFLDKLEESMKRNVENLVQVFQKMTQILNNQNQSVRMQRQAVEQLSKQYPDEVTSLFFISQLAIRKSLPSASEGSTLPHSQSGYSSTRPSWSHPTTRAYPTSQSWNWPGRSTPPTPRFPPFPRFSTRSF